MNNLFVPAALTLSLMLPLARADQGSEKSSGISPKELADQIGSRITRLHSSAWDLANKLRGEIEEQSGLKVECESGYLGGIGSLESGKCYAGVESVSAALGDIKPQVTRNALDDVKVVVGERGTWEALTRENKRMVFPYDASPKKIADYVNTQFKSYYGTSEIDVEKMNASLAGHIHDNYFFKVQQSPDLNSNEYYAGLKRLLMAMQALYGKEAPSSKLSGDFGFDSIMIGKKYSNTFEQNGELNVQIDYNGRPGDILLHLVTQIVPMSDPKPGFVRKYRNLDKYTWTDVRVFREDQAQVDELIGWFGQNTPSVKVNCVLQGPHAIYLKECVAGLHNLVNVVTTYRPAEFKAQQILIGGILTHRIPVVNLAFGHATQEKSDAIIVDYDDSPKEMYEQLVQR